MEIREDLISILPFLPLIHRSSSLFWPSQALEALKALSRGPDYSKVDSGEVLFDFIIDLRRQLGLSAERLANYAGDGYVLFFDELMSRLDSGKWFGEVVPALACLLLRLPSLLEAHYFGADSVFGEDKEGSRIKTGLRILGSHEAGIVYLSQELIGALLACSLFCLFPNINRGTKHLPTINFDQLFVVLYPSGSQHQENKIKCLIHYFEQICLRIPTGFVSFERKVLPLRESPICVSYPKAHFWCKSDVLLCPFEVLHLGLIEDQQYEALEVDFANKYLGGGALYKGCVQEEIRFMINPELIVGMLFLPCMEDNETIEVVGTERFSNYMGYASSFLFVGNYLDKKQLDSLGRKRTRIVAIDALCNPRMRQYSLECILRETNKAFCGFFDQSKYQSYLNILQKNAFCRDQVGWNKSGISIEAGNTLLVGDDTSAAEMGIDDLEKAMCCNYSPKTESRVLTCSTPEEICFKMSAIGSSGTYNSKNDQETIQPDNVGIATGNWGCGAFGGDPELKCMIQWLAASQALRPFILYHTFGEASLQRLEEVTRWILSHNWTVGDLWNMLVEHASQRLNGKTRMGFLDWVLPSPPEQGSVLTDDVSASK